MHKAKKILKFLVLAPIFIAAFGGLTMLLWNKLVPELFHGPYVNFWQACGLIILSHILFRGGGFKHGHGWNAQKWRYKMEKKMEGMTPEERDKFMEKWGSWGAWGCCPYTHEKTPDTKPAT